MLSIAGNLNNDRRDRIPDRIELDTRLASGIVRRVPAVGWRGNDSLYIIIEGIPRGHI